MRIVQIRNAIYAILVLGLVGCNIGVNAPGLGYANNDAAGTIVAMTLAAIAHGKSSNTAVPFASPAGPTPNPAKPILTINNPTNCRSGPGLKFELITAFNPGTTLTILGKDSTDGFWLVQLPNGIDTCWASGQYSTASGGFASLPEVTPTGGAVGSGVSYYDTTSVAFGSSVSFSVEAYNQAGSSPSRTISYSCQ